MLIGVKAPPGICFGARSPIGGTVGPGLEERIALLLLLSAAESGALCFRFLLLHRVFGSGSRSGADAEVLPRVLQRGFGANPIPVRAAVGGAEPEVPQVRTETIALHLEPGWGDGQTDRQTDRRTERHTDPRLGGGIAVVKSDKND